MPPRRGCCQLLPRRLLSVPAIYSNPLQPHGLSLLSEHLLRSHPQSSLLWSFFWGEGGGRAWGAGGAEPGGAESGLQLPGTRAEFWGKNSRVPNPKKPLLFSFCFSDRVTA